MIMFGLIIVTNPQHLHVRALTIYSISISILQYSIKMFMMVGYFDDKGKVIFIESFLNYLSFLFSLLSQKTIFKYEWIFSSIISTKIGRINQNEVFVIKRRKYQPQHPPDLSAALK